MARKVSVGKGLSRRLDYLRFRRLPIPKELADQARDYLGREADTHPGSEKRNARHRETVDKPLQEGNGKGPEA